MPNFRQILSQGQLNHFRTTQWSLVLQSKSAETNAAREAWGALCFIYWRPLYVFLRKKGHTHPDAEDYVQDFFRLLYEKQSFRGVLQKNGRFRSYLLKSLNNFVVNDYHKRMALKRGGSTITVPICVSPEEGEALVDPVDTRTPEESYDKQCALALIEQALAILEEEFASGEKAAWFQALKPHLTGDANVPLRQVAAQLRISEDATRVALFRLRDRFRSTIRDLVRATVSHEKEVEEELKSLIAALSA